MRKASLDLGRKYTYRIFMYTSIFLALYGFLAVFFTLTFFDLLSYKIPFSVMVLGYFDIVVILGIILQMLKTGAEVNSYFAKHKGILLTLKRHFLEIKTRYQALCLKTRYDSETLQMMCDKLKELNLP